MSSIPSELADSFVTKGQYRPEWENRLFGRIGRNLDFQAISCPETGRSPRLYEDSFVIWISQIALDGEIFPESVQAEFLNVGRFAHPAKTWS